MRTSTGRNAVRRAVDLLVAMLLSAASATAQDRQTLQELKALHDELCDSQRVVSADRAQEVRQQLREWNLVAERLQARERGWLLRTELYAALAVGDPSVATEKTAALRQQAPEEAETLQAAYLVGLVTGNAEAAQAALEKLAAGEAAPARNLAARRGRWLRRVGQPAPTLEIPVEGGPAVAVHERHGTVLLVDFWNMRDTTPEYAATLKTLRAVYAAESRVLFVGVNSDGAVRRTAAQAWAQTAGYSWPQHYEEQAGRGPIKQEAFHAGSPPWTVLIDGSARVRAVGAVTEPGFQYALRAAVAEVSGRLAGEQRAKPREPGQVSKDELPSDPQAQALLREARTYLKTGMKKKAKELLERIIREYPGTREARDAKERLAYLP